MTVEMAEKIRLGSLEIERDELLRDFRLASQSRQASLIGRREVLSGKAKFGIFGDGKEIPQLAMAKVFEPGDFRSGYYRDQTFMLATGMMSLQEFFAQLYAHTDVDADPASAGRSMNGHFATRLLNPDGSWKNLSELKNSSADVSPTGSQMPRLVGLAYASRLYREVAALRQFSQFSHGGSEVAFGTIGNASTSEGMFWEAINAIGVLKAPALITIYDDGYGISVTNEHQMVKQDLSALLSGFQRKPGTHEGYDIHTVKGWDYPALLHVYQQAAETARKEHVPQIVHVIEVTQPQGHSTSGSHERYKNAARLAFEQDFDGLAKLRQLLMDAGAVSEQELQEWEKEDHQIVEEIRKAAWEAFTAPILKERQALAALIEQIAARSQHAVELAQIKARLISLATPQRREHAMLAKEVLRKTRQEVILEKQTLRDWLEQLDADSRERFASHLYAETGRSALDVPEIKPVYRQNAPEVNGFEVINACFDAALGREPRLVAFGEDVGRLGDVNQGFKGLQEKYGELRVSDTGIREVTILGQAIGLAMRGLRPIAEIQYLDYLLYALQLMSDDLAMVRWRTKGGQMAPVIVRTRGHRLEGIWHSGSPMAGIIHLTRGMHVLVPRNMTQAAGFYNTLLQADEPGLIVEVLNGYRIKERLPENIGEMTVPLGVPEVLRAGEDLTIVTYGASCRIALHAAEMLGEVGVAAEVIDVQSLLPFDLPGIIGNSLRKTSRILFVDEDMPGGTTAYMLQQVLEHQGGYQWLDSAPRTLPGAEHRPAYGSDGDYWSKPNAETIFDAAYAIMHEADPRRFPEI